MYINNFRKIRSLFILDISNTNPKSSKLGMLKIHDCFFLYPEYNMDRSLNSITSFFCKALSIYQISCIHYIWATANTNRPTDSETDRQMNTPKHNFFLAVVKMNTLYIIITVIPLLHYRLYTLWLELTRQQNCLLGRLNSSEIWCIHEV